MNRRDAISRVAIILGGTVLGAEAFISGCRNPGNEAGLSGITFTKEDVAFLDEVAEAIIPATDTPGAKAAKVGEFMTRIVTDCYDAQHQKIFMDGMGKLNDACNSRYQRSFIQCKPQERHDFLYDLDKEQQDYAMNKKNGDPVHYFRMMKELTLLGYFSSEIGATKALRYVAVPGKYEGSVDYHKGDKAWATS